MNMKRIKALHDMDTCIRMLSDEENGIFEYWISELLPDQATNEEIVEILEDDPTFYSRCCEFFARNISHLIVNGEWNGEGWTTEFYNRIADRRLDV